MLQFGYDPHPLPQIAADNLQWLPLRSLLFAVVLGCPASLATATQLTLDATDYATSVNGSPFFTATVPGWCPCDPIAEERTFYIFDLSSVVGTVTAAELRLEMAAGGYESPDGTETFQINEVTSSIAALLSPFNDMAVFDDLGDGTALGSAVVSAASEGTIVTIALNSAALTLLNNQAGTQIAFGGAVTSLTKGPSLNELIFLQTPGQSLQRQLVLTIDATAVPEPATFGLAAAALAGLIALRRRR